MFIKIHKRQRLMNLNRFIIKGTVMRSKEIENINEALLVLRHFIDLSAQLLPLLYKLQVKPTLSQEEALSIRKISEVYNQYSFDTDASKFLIDSDVLLMIKSSFDKIKDGNSRTRRKAVQNLREFLEEYKRLQHNWDLTIAN